MASGADPKSAQPEKKVTRKPSQTVVGAEETSPPAHGGRRDSIGQGSKRSASEVSAGSESDFKPPTPPKLEKGLKLGQFMPWGTLQLPSKYPSLKEVDAKAQASAANPPKEEAAKSTSLPARPASP